MIQTPTPMSADLVTANVGIWITVISSLASGIVGVIASLLYTRYYEKRKMKLDTLKRFVANRFDLKGDEFSRALNEVFVVFQDSRSVMQALSNYHDAVTGKSESLDHLLRLFKAMCRDVNVNVDFNDSFFLKPFNTRPDSAA
jgi:uncharacterized protein DUF6680